ncbi:MAG: 50S ribosomal protein L14 [Zestosphaera sp.]
MSEKKGGAAIERLGRAAGITLGTSLKVADNSGAKLVMVVGIPGVKTRLRRRPSATVGDLVTVAVKKGSTELVGQVLQAVIIRQRRPFRRHDGRWLCFEDNACVVIAPDGTPKGTEVRGPMAREAAERWPKIATLASIII